MNETQAESPEQPEPAEREPYEGERVPTWTRDFLRVLGVVLVLVLFFTFLIWAVAAGPLGQLEGFLRQIDEFFRQKLGLVPLEDDGFIRQPWALRPPVDIDAYWVGMSAGLMVLGFPFLFVENKRMDNGFRRTGLVPLTILSVLFGGVIATAVMVTWPLILGDKAIPGTVFGDLGKDPAGFLLVLFFIIGGMSWCLSVGMPMIIGGWKFVLWLGLPFLGTLFCFTFAGSHLFENPTSRPTIIIWVVAAVSGMAVLTVVALLRNIIDKPSQSMSDAQRVEAQS